MFTRSALTGAVLATAIGLLLWGTRLGKLWENASYDYAYLFGSHAATNPIVFIKLEGVADEAKRDFAREREQHAELLERLTAEGARLVVFDVFFQTSSVAHADEKFAQAIRRNGRVVLIGIPADTSRLPTLNSGSFIPPYALLLNAAAGCGLGYVDSETLQTARQHWPFWQPGEGDFHSLGWVAAETDGIRLDSKIENQWLRYYGRNGPGEQLWYSQVSEKPSGFFHGKIIFIGSWPTMPNDPGSSELNNDKFSTPYTHWTGQSIGGMVIHATTFLNLENGDWLQRLPVTLEFFLLVATGFLIGGGLRLLKPLPALLAAIGIFFVVMCLFVTLSYATNHWFPWLTIAGGQLPLALAWAWSTWTRHVIIFHERFPGYEPIGEAFGSGAYGKVWLVRNATGQLQALKEIELAKFEDASPYEREFRGIKNYKPISNQHPGLLHIDHVNRNEHEGYFYYVMELGDAYDAGWEKNGGTYQPRDLFSACRQQSDYRLSVRECVRLGIVLLEALDFLHQLGLVHRDIKPANIIFVNGRPKLADVGLVRESSAGATWVGTDFYMPPAPEPPGTKPADIYATGKLLYVISTGSSVKNFPELPDALVSDLEFMRLNTIICRACQPAASQRYATIAEMLAALRELQAQFDEEPTRRM